MRAHDLGFPSFPIYTLAGLGMPRRAGRSPEIPSLNKFHISIRCNMIVDLPCVVSSRFPGHSQSKSCRSDSQCFQAEQCGRKTRLDQGDLHRKEAI